MYFRVGGSQLFRLGNMWLIGLFSYRLGLRILIACSGL